MSAVLIGIAGPARSGKDTLAHYFREQGFAVTAFAEPIKQALVAAFDLTDAQLHGDDKERPVPWLGGVTPRRMMQTFGTDWARKMVADDVWIRVAQQRVARFLEHPEIHYPGVVFSDVRFDNEADWIRDQGGIVMHLYRDDCLPVEAHVSEAGILVDERDWIVPNNGTITELYNRIEDLCKEQLGGEFWGIASDD